MALARPRALWLQLRNVPILRMLQLEEALFRTDRRSWFITNEWDSAQPAAEALVLGISGRPEQMLHVEAAVEPGSVVGVAAWVQPVAAGGNSSGRVS